MSDQVHSVQDTMAVGSQAGDVDEVDVMPPHLRLFFGQFDFKFEQFDKIMSTTVSCNSELLASFRALQDYVSSAELDEEIKAKLMDLVSQEVDVISYAHTARCSVISL